jgi:hypothetical protein
LVYELLSSPLAVTGAKMPLRDYIVQTPSAVLRLALVRYKAGRSLGSADNPVVDM